MTHASLRAQLGYAVLEGVSFGINDGLQALKESGTPIAQCSLVAGAPAARFGPSCWPIFSLCRW
ncbi:Xylulose kinase [Klebsiella pneumoniae]|uniref:Xylulose kinase n=1 Tax=Klebsiella pneumoniae TaxID=573 RepID=A0A2X3IHU8_KLEPN|nr:Xylulose kinase [Klebsiella pneumoniae]